MTNYKHLNIDERYTIKEMPYQKKTITEIAKLLNRSKWTISMEISRNSDIGQYMPYIIQRKYKSRLHKFEMTKTERNPELQEYIADAIINKKWSPDAISGRMKLENHQETI